MAVLEIGDPEADEFGEALEKLTKELAHHVDEEERTVLNPARTEVAAETRRELGVPFMTERQAQLDAGCGSIDNVRKLVNAAKTRDQI